ncbi:META domain-containing protein [Plantactinospora sp. GCM10030261]|uniref:META domain-containing protein n=1 Tax=Plantactinospora sp. GCM10030261 TaxID=3273420 RepID=UPI00361A725B
MRSLVARAALVAAALTITGLTSAACARPDTLAAPVASVPAPDPLTGRTFWSVDVTESGSPRAMAPNTRVELHFAPDGTLRASAGCNQLSGSVRLTGNRLTVPEMSGTDMGCDQARMAQDQWLIRFLGDGPTWQVAGDQLTLDGSVTRIRFTDREVADPDRPLTGTTWTVDTIVDGETASSLPAGARAHLTVSTDGRLTGSTGCNEIGGTADVRADTIVVTGLTATERACDGPAGSLESAVLAVLSGTVNHRVDGRFLTLTQPSGDGLRLVAGG